MIQLIRTNSENIDFIILVKFLDSDLAKRDGEDHSFYAQFNKLDNIKHALVVYQNHNPVGCGAIKQFEPDSMEVKRMYTLPEFRGQGIATIILLELEKWAKDLGYKKCVLETGKRQPEAIQLYTKNGYKTLPNYGQYTNVENSICFEKIFKITMEYKTLIDNVKIPVLGLGTWLIGGDLEPDYSDDTNAISAIKKAIELGYSHLDTAELYGNGHCEELIGEAIKSIDRKKLFITSKVRETKLKYNDVIVSAKESLKRLQTDYIDLFLIHSPNPSIPIEETMKAFDYLVDQKMVKYIGVSNFTVDQLIEAQNYTKHKIVANQIEYSLLTRNIGKYSGNNNMESKTIPYCQENNIIVMAERPIERGLILESHFLLDKLEVKYNKTKAQIAMNWLISKKNIITIPKSTNVNHLKENMGAMGWKLEKEDIKLLDEIKYSN